MFYRPERLGGSLRGRDMADDLPTFPRLRAIEAFPVEHEGEQMILLQDPAGLAQSPIVVSPAGFAIMTLLDGRHSLDDVCAQFEARVGQALPRERVEEMVGQLDLANYLESPRFAAFFEELVEDFRAAPARVSRDAGSFGAENDGLGPVIDRMLGDGIDTSHLALRTSQFEPKAPRHDARLAGLIAPHLDYARGGPCYEAAYGVVAANGAPQRVIILGTNHYGRGTSVVATGKDFDTPLGLTRTDRAFLSELERACGVDLRAHEFDHAREHSVELQLLILQHLLGTDRFEIVPLLCPDVCGPTGTAPADGDGVDLGVFADELGRLVNNADKHTLVIAGADLSHFGSRFGDDCELDPPFLAEIERKDRDVLGAVVTGKPELFVDVIRVRDNDTRICSAGSIYVLMRALSGARPELLRYYQTVDRDSGTAVSCSAMAFWW